MRRAAGVLSLVLLLACGKGEVVGLPEEPPGGGPSFRLLQQGQNAAYCVQGPEFEVATTREEWRAILARESECQPGSAPPDLEVSFETEIGVAAWWKVAGCLGYGLETKSVVREGDAVRIEARTSKPVGDACAQALGGLESFLAVRRSLAEGASRIVFVLDGTEAGSVTL